jgi:predicted dehydrogenase
MGDIGVHAFNLAELVAGLEVVEIAADLRSVVPGRELDDDATALLRFSSGAAGVLVASQICTGEENDLTLRVYGEKASLAWRQEEPNSLWLRSGNAPVQLLRTGGSALGGAAAAHTRLPAGHPEGYLEAFANVYRNFAAHVRARETGSSAQLPYVPGIEAALRGMAFIETAVAASRSERKWHPLQKVRA